MNEHREREGEAARITYRLHLLGLLGRDEGDEADELRDRGEALWYTLDAPARRRLRSFSAELNRAG